MQLHLPRIIAWTLACAWLIAFASALYAQEPNQIALVIVHGDGSATTRCVEFSEAELSGIDVLQRSQLSLNTDLGSMGSAVCSLDGEGCVTPQEDCFCGMNRNPSVYWSYWEIVNKEWQYSQMGAGNKMVQPGGVEGWIWGTGRIDEAAPPPVYTFEQICAEPTATETATATVTEAATAAATATDIPSPTSTTTFTPWPTATSTLPVPTATPTPSPIPSATLSPTPSPTSTWTPRPTVTSTPLPQQIVAAAQPTATEDYSIRLPVVHVPAPTTPAAEALPVIEETLIALAVMPSLTPALQPSSTPTPTASPEILANTAIPPIPTQETISVTPEVVVIVITAPAVSVDAAVVSDVQRLPTESPSAAPPRHSHFSMLVGVSIGAGMMFVLSLCLFLVVTMVYWVGRKL
jgi:hypothetical protein